MIRWIDELNNVTDADENAKKIRREIKKVKKSPNSASNSSRIRSLYAQLDEIQFKPDYMCVIMDSNSDYYRACKGFYINGIKYRRLLGTNGGIKSSTIVFTSERLYEELHKRIENGRDENKELVTAKLEAYRALTCSASNPVSDPNGILVINNIETEFREDIIYMNDENSDEPEIEFRKNELVKIDPTDGCGMILPSLAKRWSKELDLDYVASGFNLRYCWSKGMVFPFDFIDFAENVAHKYIVKDAWGEEVDIRNVEMILTTSQLKLWDSYKSCKEFMDCCHSNNYTFGVAKIAPEYLENERCLNYQFIQSYNLSEEDIDELIAPTMDTIREILGGDYRKMILFAKGKYLNERSVAAMPNDYIKALMINPEMVNDQYVRSRIFSMLRGRIKDAKIGVIQVHGNYSIISGDLYALCQGMFGMPITGLLKAGEIYSEYWSGSEKLACFRAPMTCHNNIRMVYPQNRADVNYWFRYIKTCTVLNSWDLIANSLNGADFDGDICMLTDNDVLLRNYVQLPSIMCIQRKAQKRVSNESDFIKSNIDSFGNDIGQTTNWITSMFEVQAGYDVGSEEYDELSYRIMCGQLFQQNAIDKSKGVIVKPMPKYWHDRKRALAKDFEDDSNKQASLVADKKPYFMTYIYPQLMAKYKKFIKDSNKHMLREFSVSMDEMLKTPDDELSTEQREMLKYYRKMMPVGTNDCVMNIICHKFEEEFDGFFKNHNDQAPNFDYSILKSGAEYSSYTYNKIRKLYKDYQGRIKSYEYYRRLERVDDDEFTAKHFMMKNEFITECSKVCTNEEVLCNIVVDMCYTNSNSKSFAWDVSGGQIIENLLLKSGYIIQYPRLDDDGDIQFDGNKFSMESCELTEGGWW